MLQIVDRNHLKTLKFMSNLIKNCYVEVFFKKIVTDWKIENYANQ